MEPKILFIGLEICHEDIMRRVREMQLLNRLRLDIPIVINVPETEDVSTSYQPPEPMMLYNFNHDLVEPTVTLEPFRKRKGKSKKYQPSALERLNQSRNAKIGC